MRLPFPERIPLIPVCWFASILCIIQQFQGTNPTFSLCCFFYILVSTYAFNIAGGFTRTSGAFIFFNSVLSLIVGLFVKAYLGEAADSNLAAPMLTIKVELFGMCMMAVAAYLSRRVTPKRPLLGKMVTDANMQTATVGSLVSGMALSLALLAEGMTIGGNLFFRDYPQGPVRCDITGQIDLAGSHVGGEFHVYGVYHATERRIRSFRAQRVHVGGDLRFGWLPGQRRVQSVDWRRRQDKKRTSDDGSRVAGVRLCRKDVSSFV